MKKNSAFSLIELSIVILVIGILVAGVTESRGLITKFRLNSARSLTSSSPVNSMKDLILWLDATSASSVNDSLGDGDLVDKWSNISSQQSPKTNFIQSKETHKPTYKTNGINGIPTLSFLTDDYLTSDSSISISPNYSFFVVFNTSDSTGEIADIFGLNKDTDTNDNNSNYEGSATVFEINSDNTIRSLYRSTVSSSGGDSSTSSKTINLKSNYIMSYSRNFASKNESLWINNEAFIGNGATTPSVTNGVFEKTNLYGVIGKLGDRDVLAETAARKRIFNGQISEIIIFDRALMKDEIDDVEKYLSKKYSIELK
jgi:prepilin-type N-terminal cleavage/methylation domain-containing protein